MSEEPAAQGFPRWHSPVFLLLCKLQSYILMPVTMQNPICRRRPVSTGSTSRLSWKSWSTTLCIFWDERETQGKSKPGVAHWEGCACLLEMNPPETTRAHRTKRAFENLVGEVGEKWYKTTPNAALFHRAASKERPDHVRGGNSSSFPPGRAFCAKNSVGIKWQRAKWSRDTATSTETTWALSAGQRKPLPKRLEIAERAREPCRLKSATKREKWKVTWTNSSSSQAVTDHFWHHWTV